MSTTEGTMMTKKRPEKWSDLTEKQRAKVSFAAIFVFIGQQAAADLAFLKGW